jgi:soluble lytic murein transglycosylase-like protein
MKLNASKTQGGVMVKSKRAPLRFARHAAFLACVLIGLCPAALHAGPAPTQTADASDALPQTALATPRADGGIESYRALVRVEARQDGLPWEIADAVMAVESGYNPGAIGTSGEIGLMQILPSTARVAGFSGSDLDLAVPETNIHYGVNYLAEAWNLAGGDLCTAVMKYRAGHGETRFSYRSVDYCLAVRSKLFARGYPVTGDVPVATFGENDISFGGHHGVGGRCRHCLGDANGRVNLAALNSQLSTIVAQVRFGK